MAHLQITEKNYELEVEQASGLVLLDFYATWCGPCKMLAPVLDEIAEQFPAIKVCKSDVDDAPQLAAKFGVQSIPTVVLLKNGERLDGFVGYRNKEQIEPLLEKYL